ncbi:MAG: Na/Pi cotransporter family protein [Bacillaceae bacterium]
MELKSLELRDMLFEFFGGLGIFLFSIKFMGDGLQKSAGDRLRDILDRFTTNPLMGVLAGILVTVLIQSSSGTTVITVGLVSAGFMSLRQAIGVIMGANIGTTVTAFIIGIKLTDYALPILAVGAVLLFFFKNNKIQNIGQVVFGFGGLFYGMSLMSGGMKPLTKLAAFQDLTLQMSETPILGVVVGTFLTVVVQSSSATIGILQSLFGEGAISLQAAIPVLFGDNIGTTITAILAAIGASVAARRAAATHVLFNIIGSVLFLLILPWFTRLIEFFQASLNLNPEMTIAFAHGTFNVTNTLIQLPFIGVLAYLVTKLVPGQDVVVEFKPKHLDPNFITQSPSIALGQAKQEVIRMGNFANDGLERVAKYITTNDRKHADLAIQVEDALNNLDKKITEYLVKLSSTQLNQNESAEHIVLMDTVRDIERIGDHFENIIELVELQNVNRTKMSESALHNLEEMFELTISTVQKAIKALENDDKQLATVVITEEEKIDTLERKFRKQHIKRMNEGQSTAIEGTIFVDIVSNLERIGDHAVNIAEAVLGVRH